MKTGRERGLRVEARDDRLSTAGGQVQHRRMQAVRSRSFTNAGAARADQRLPITQIYSAGTCPSRAEVHEVLDELSVLNRAVPLAATRGSHPDRCTCAGVDVARLAGHEHVVVRLLVERERAFATALDAHLQRSFCAREHPERFQEDHVAQFHTARLAPVLQRGSRNLDHPGARDHGVAAAHDVFAEQPGPVPTERRAEDRERRVVDDDLRERGMRARVPDRLGWWRGAFVLRVDALHVLGQHADVLPGIPVDRERASGAAASAQGKGVQNVRPHGRPGSRIDATEEKSTKVERLAREDASSERALHLGINDRGFRDTRSEGDDLASACPPCERRHASPKRSRTRAIARPSTPCCTRCECHHVRATRESRNGADPTNSSSSDASPASHRIVLVGRAADEHELHASVRRVLGHAAYRGAK
jgi:hypothetical protein